MAITRPQFGMPTFRNSLSITAPKFSGVFRDPNPLERLFDYMDDNHPQVTDWIDKKLDEIYENPQYRFKNRLSSLSDGESFTIGRQRGNDIRVYHTDREFMAFTAFDALFTRGDRKQLFLDWLHNIRDFGVEPRHYKISATSKGYWVQYIGNKKNESLTRRNGDQVELSKNDLIPLYPGDRIPLGYKTLYVPDPLIRILGVQSFPLTPREEPPKE